MDCLTRFLDWPKIVDCLIYSYFIAICDSYKRNFIIKFWAFFYYYKLIVTKFENFFSIDLIVKQA